MRKKITTVVQPETVTETTDAVTNEVNQAADNKAKADTPAKEVKKPKLPKSEHLKNAKSVSVNGKATIYNF